MSRTPARHETRIEDGQVYVETDGESVHVGDVDTIIRLVGGPAWTISYSEWQKRRYPDLDTSDEGLTVDIVDMVNGMSFDSGFVTALETLPDEPIEDEDVPPRMGLFVGRLLGNLETGLE